MKHRLLKVLLVSTLSSLFLSASDRSYYMDEENDPIKLQKEAMGKITPTVAPVVKHGIDAFLIGNFIYWNTRVDNVFIDQKSALSSTDYQFLKNDKSKNVATLVPVETTYNPSAKHSVAPGFKVGAGFNFCHDGWDLLARYTWLHSHGKSLSLNSTLLMSDIPTFSFFQGAVSASQLNSYWKLHFNSFDLELGRAFYISQRLILRPLMSLKASWQTQYLNKNFVNLSKNIYDVSNTGALLATSTGGVSSYNEVYFWGLGIRPGLCTSWQINDCFSVFSDGYVSALWGNFKSTRKDYSTNTSTSTSEISYTNLLIANLKSQYHTISAVVEFQLGLRWETKFSNDDYRIRLQASWEEQVYFNQNQFIILGKAPYYGNLCMQGLNIEARLDF